MSEVPIHFLNGHTLTNHNNELPTTFVAWNQASVYSLCLKDGNSQFLQSDNKPAHINIVSSDKNENKTSIYSHHQNLIYASQSPPK